MASNVSTVDGMGFEEVNQASFTEIVSGTNVYGTTGSFVTTRVTTENVATSNVTTSNVTIGSITNIRTTNTNVVGSVTDIQGRYRSSLLGSSTTNIWGGFVQAGSFDTDAGSQGIIAFGVPYTSATSYYVNAIPTGSATGIGDSYISGTRNASGVNFVGATTLRYDFIAVGN